MRRVRIFFESSHNLIVYNFLYVFKITFYRFWPVLFEKFAYIADFLCSLHNTFEIFSINTVLTNNTQFNCKKNNNIVLKDNNNKKKRTNRKIGQAGQLKINKSKKKKRIILNYFRLILHNDVMICLFLTLCGNFRYSYN